MQTGHYITCRRQHLGFVPRQRHHGGPRRQRPILVRAAPSAARGLPLSRTARCLLPSHSVQLWVLALRYGFLSLRFGPPPISLPRPALPAALQALAAPLAGLPASREGCIPAGGTDSRHDVACKHERRARDKLLEELM